MSKLHICDSWIFSISRSNAGASGTVSQSFCAIVSAACRWVWPGVFLTPLFTFHLDTVLAPSSRTVMVRWKGRREGVQGTLHPDFLRQLWLQLCLVSPGKDVRNHCSNMEIIISWYSNYVSSTVFAIRYSKNTLCQVMCADFLSFRKIWLM